MRGYIILSGIIADGTFKLDDISQNWGDIDTLIHTLKAATLLVAQQKEVEAANTAKPRLPIRKVGR